MLVFDISQLRQCLRFHSPICHNYFLLFLAHGFFLSGMLDNPSILVFSAKFHPWAEFSLIGLWFRRHIALGRWPTGSGSAPLERGQKVTPRLVFSPRCVHPLGRY